MTSRGFSNKIAPGAPYVRENRGQPHPSRADSEAWVKTAPGNGRHWDGGTPWVQDQRPDGRPGWDSAEDSVAETVQGVSQGVWGEKSRGDERGCWRNRGRAGVGRAHGGCQLRRRAGGGPGPHRLEPGAGREGGAADGVSVLPLWPWPWGFPSSRLSVPREDGMT